MKRRKFLRKGEGFESGLQWTVSFPLRKVRKRVQRRWQLRGIEKPLFCGFSFSNEGLNGKTL